MTTTFEKQLISCNEAAIEKDIATLNSVAEDLNQLSEAWKREFLEEFDLKVFSFLPITDEKGNITRYLKVHHIELHPELSKIYGPGKLNVEKLFEPGHYTFPDFTDLSRQIATAKIRIKNNCNFDISLLAHDNGFGVSEQLREKVIATHTYYTTNFRENVALELFNRFSELFTITNHLGLEIYPKDLPQSVGRYFTTESATPKYEYLENLSNSGHRNIPEFRVNPTFSKNPEFNSKLMKQMMNLSDKDISELYDQLIGPKNN
jgi:hypothetical protein